MLFFGRFAEKFSVFRSLVRHRCVRSSKFQDLPSFNDRTMFSSDTPKAGDISVDLAGKFLKTGRISFNIDLYRESNKNEIHWIPWTPTALLPRCNSNFNGDFKHVFVFGSRHVWCHSNTGAVIVCSKNHVSPGKFPKMEARVIYYKLEFNAIMFRQQLE